MANPNPTIPVNPNIVEDGKKTQFGQPDGADPVKAAKSENKKASWSVRAELRHISAQALDLPEDCTGEEFQAALDKELRRLRMTGKGVSTLARLTAIRQFEKAIKKSDTHAANFVTENIEGKLSQEIVLPPTKIAPTEFTSIEDAAEVYKEFIGT